MIKSVAQAIPVYSMSCFRLPRGLCDKITSIIRQFWWGSKRGQRKPTWVAWDVMIRPKYMGGMGFREFEKFNLALLGKHGWRLITHPNSLCSRVLKGKYFPDCDFLQANAPTTSSATWKAIIAGRKALQTGLIKRVGNGDSISIWNDSWIPTTSTLKPMGRIGNDPLQWVSELIDDSRGTWDIKTVRRNFLAPDAEAKHPYSAQRWRRFLGMGL